MGTHVNLTGWNTEYALWHLPSSTLLVSTVHLDEVGGRVQRAVADGIVMDDLMLQVTRTDELFGRQHLGARIVDVLKDLLESLDLALRGA